MIAQHELRGAGTCEDEARIGEVGQDLHCSGAITVCSFHPELSHDLRLHERFLEGL